MIKIELPPIRFPYTTWLDCAVSGAQFLTGGVFECDIAHRWSVAVLVMLYKIRYRLMHLLNDALSGPYVPVWVTCSGLVAHQYTYSPPCCRTSQYRRTFVPLCVSLEWSCWHCVGWCLTGRFQEQGQCFYMCLSCSIPTPVFTVFPFLFFLSKGWYCDPGVLGLIGCISLFLLTSFNNNNYNTIRWHCC